MNMRRGREEDHTAAAYVIGFVEPQRRICRCACHPARLQASLGGWTIAANEVRKEGARDGRDPKYDVFFEPIHLGPKAMTNQAGFPIGAASAQKEPVSQAF